MGHPVCSLLNKCIRKHLKKTNDLWRMVETYIKLKGKWMYLYRAVDTKGDTVDFFDFLKIEIKLLPRDSLESRLCRHTMINLE